MGAETTQVTLMDLEPLTASMRPRHDGRGNAH